MKKKMTKVEESIYENTAKIRDVKKIVKKRVKSVENKEIIPDPIASDSWKDKEFSHPEKTVRIGTVFSGIGAIEHAFRRLRLKHKIVFAGDIDPACKKSYFSNYDIDEKDWFSDIREFDTLYRICKSVNATKEFLDELAACRADYLEMAYGIGKGTAAEKNEITITVESEQKIETTVPPAQPAPFFMPQMMPAPMFVMGVQPVPMYGMMMNAFRGI